MLNLLRSKGSGALLLTLFLVCLAQRATAETATIAYAKLAAFQASFDSIPPAQRDRLILSLQILHADPANHTPIHLWADLDGKRTDIPVAPDGDVALPTQPDWTVRGVMLQTDQPRHSLQLKLGLRIRPPPGTSFPVNDLADAVPQAQQAINTGARQLAGLLAIFATPTIHAIRISFPRCCTETVTLQASGRTVLTQDKSGTITLPVDTLDAYRGGTLTASAPITKLDPSTD
jgi:hypothetical protein